MQTYDDWTVAAAAAWEAYLRVPPEDRPFAVDPAVKPSEEILRGRGPERSRIDSVTRTFAAGDKVFVEAAPGRRIRGEICGPADDGYHVALAGGGTRLVPAARLTKTGG